MDPVQSEGYYREGRWRADSLWDVFQVGAYAHPERPAIVERARTHTYRDLLDAAGRLAGWLHEQGLRDGDRVAVWLPSRAEVAVAVLACARLGLVCCPSLHRDHTVGQVVELAERMRAAAFIGQPGYGADAERHDIFAELGTLATSPATLHVAPLTDPSSQPDQPGEPGMFADLAASPAPPAHRTHADAVVYLAFTSGSTGEPKGVMHSSNTLLSPVRAMARDWALGGDTVIYSLSPLSHNLGFGAMLTALTNGGTLVAHDLPRGASVAERMAETATAFAFGVPTHVIDLLGEIERGHGQGLRLRGFRISGAAVSEDVVLRLRARGITPQTGYGMTEAGSHHYTRAEDAPELIAETSGRPFEGHEVKIVDREDSTRELPAGEVGQILGRGPSITLGYFDDQRATEASITDDGWLLTGDLGWQDENGYIRITGRKKDVIIRGGHNIFPARIEGLAGGCPGVAAVAAVSVPDPRLGERVCLVVTSKEQPPAADDVLQHLDRAGLSKYDMPEFYAVMGALPLLPSGKVDKRKIEALIADKAVAIEPVRFTEGAKG
ncbi:class I adenylate-forming enzyme family protein [Nocardioides sp.]|uniref:class I adenylate-forming enzyme family protein n=1 Tax=Nocardioides sp. TaxID=35761 RepID=UPI002626E859|nr:class I adenylate-forming enzyme family protein [Nocardioides sp.]